MRLSDIYKHKETNEIIQIDSFATGIGKRTDMVIVFTRMFNDGMMIGSCPSFNGYGTREEIESKYELLVDQDNIRDYKSWDEIFELVGE